MNGWRISGWAKDHISGKIAAEYFVDIIITYIPQKVPAR
jgi:hypothetical protein